MRAGKQIGPARPAGAITRSNSRDEARPAGGNPGHDRTPQPTHPPGSLEGVPSSPPRSGSGGGALLQRSSAGGPDSEIGSTEDPGAVQAVLRSPGTPLDEETRGFMESRFHHDFSRVRLHTDARGAESARAVHAIAYTVGSDIAFRDGAFSPGTTAGRKLLAHELTHVVQQGGGERRRGAAPAPGPRAPVAVQCKREDQGDGGPEGGFLRKLMSKASSFNLIVGSVAGSPGRARLSLRRDPKTGKLSFEGYVGTAVKASQGKDLAFNLGLSATLEKNFGKIVPALQKLAKSGLWQGQGALIPSASAGVFFNFGKGPAASANPPYLTTRMLQFQIAVAGYLVNLMADEDFLMGNVEELSKTDLDIDRLVGKLGFSVGPVFPGIPLLDVSVFEEVRVFQLTPADRSGGRHYGFGGGLHEQFYEPAEAYWKQRIAEVEGFAAAWDAKLPNLGYVGGIVAGSPTLLAADIALVLINALELVTPLTEEEHYLFFATMGLGEPAIPVIHLGRHVARVLAHWMAKSPRLAAKILPRLPEIAQSVLRKLAR